VWVELITQEENRLKQTCYAYAKRTRRTNERSRFSNLPKVSGKTMCKRSIMEGRGNVRAILYMATLVAIRHNEKFKAYYAHLKSPSVSPCAIIGIVLRAMNRWFPEPMP